MEVATYHKELKGKSKQKESFWQVLGILRKLRNYGEGFVNFGEPIPLVITSYSIHYTKLYE